MQEMEVMIRSIKNEVSGLKKRLCKDQSSEEVRPKYPPPSHYSGGVSSYSKSHSYALEKQ